ncbi:retrovirus-related pol polyprotein from transposon TNT 1-94 [Tanacetum coccineum]
MLERGSYIPWASRFRRYLNRKRDNRKWLHKALDEGPYEFKNFLPEGSTIPRLQTIKDLEGDDLLLYDAEMELMNMILLSIPNEIYNSVDACTSAKDMWKRVERLMRGTIQNRVDRETRFTNEFDQFVAEPGEALVSVYNRFAQLMNDLERNNMNFPTVTINTKFLNSLQPEWLKYVTQVRLAKRLTVDSFDDLFYYLQQFGEWLIQSRAKKLENLMTSWLSVAHTGGSYFDDGQAMNLPFINLRPKLEKMLILLLKLGNSLQGMFMLGPKPLFVYDQQLKHGLGYSNPYTLKQAISKCPKLYVASSLGKMCCILVMINAFAKHKLKWCSNTRRTFSTNYRSPKSSETTFVAHKTRFSEKKTQSKTPDTTFVVSKSKIDVESASKAKDKIVLWVVDSGCSKHMTGDRSLLRNFIEKFMGTVCFGLGHNLTGGRDSNLYTISISDMAASSPVCLMSKATSTKSWLWHRRLSHLNSGTINDLTRLDLVDGLPKFIYGKDHLCFAYERGKSKKASHPQFPDHVYRLKKALYGLKQAPRAWYDKFSSFIIEHGFTKVHYGNERLDADLQGTPTDQTTYRRMIGGLMYLTASRPDIAFATFVCARYQARPTIKHLKESSKKQDCTVMSTTEAEYVSLSACCAQVIWMCTQLLDYGYKFNWISMYCDSKSAIAISCNSVQHYKTKHIDIRYHFIKEHVEKGTVEIYFVRTEYQLANIFTKALPKERFEYLVHRIGMRCMTPTQLESLTKLSS